jgi:hypothetical protein
LKLKLILISIIIVLIILVGGWIQIKPNNEKPENTSFSSYEITIISNNTNNYIIYVPVSLIFDLNSSKPSNLMSKVSDDFIEQIETKHGIALKIEYSGNFSLKRTSNEYEPESVVLSMRAFKEIDVKPMLFVWIYYNGSEPISLSIELLSEINGGSAIKHYKEWCKDINIENYGWVQIQMKTESYISD